MKIRTLSMRASKSIPGNANLPISGRQNAIHKIGAPSGQRSATQQKCVSSAVWHSRGYIPHFESSEVVQHVTFHLADSLPQTVLLRLEAELKSLPATKHGFERRKRVDAWMDAGHGSCILRKPSLASMAQESLLSFDARRYRLLAWVVMPNHVHVLFQAISGWTVAKIVASWKKLIARKICDQRPESGEEPAAPVWRREYWDRYIRDESHLQQAIEYIHSNPVKAGLAAKAESWRWSSAYPRNADLLVDGRFEP